MTKVRANAFTTIVLTIAAGSLIFATFALSEAQRRRYENAALYQRELHMQVEAMREQIAEMRRELEMSAVAPSDGGAR